MECPAPIHIASMVVWSEASLPELEQTLNAMPGVETPVSGEKGKTVALVEAENEAALYQLIEDIRALPGVLNAQLVFHAHDDGTDEGETHES